MTARMAVFVGTSLTAASLTLVGEGVATHFLPTAAEFGSTDSIVAACRNTDVLGSSSIACAPNVVPSFGLYQLTEQEVAQPGFNGNRAHTAHTHGRHGAHH